jgi:hypothetical protein
MSEIAKILRDRPVTVEGVTRLVEWFRAQGAKVINQRGEDMTEEDIARLVEEWRNDRS